MKKLIKIINFNMESNIQKLRAYYVEFRSAAYNEDPKPITGEKVKNCRSIVTAQKNRINQTGDFNSIEELTFYEEKVNRIAKLMTKAKRNSLNRSDYLNQMKSILKDEKYVFNNSYLKKQISNSSINRPPPTQNQQISYFFENKKSQISPEAGFKSVLESVPIAQRPFKIKNTVSAIRQGKQQKSYQLEYRKLLQEHNFLKKKLQEQQRQIYRERQQQKQKEQRQWHPVPIQHDDDEEKIRLQVKLREVEEENERLAKENDKLKSSKSIAIYTVNHVDQNQNLSPYFLNPRQNDLYKINAKNSNQPTLYENYFDDHQKIESIPAHQIHSEVGNQYRPSFSMSHSIFSQRQHNSNISVNCGISSHKIVAKNKLAFFKNKMIICRDQEFQIAYKKSPLEGNYDRVRFIFYVNNRSPESASVSLKYDYQPNFYEIQVQEPLKRVEGLKQSRQVLQIKLKSYGDINSVIQAHFYIRDKQYTLWVPTIFIQFQRPRIYNIPKRLVKRIIYPNKLFDTASKTNEIMPWMKVLLNEGEMWGKSKMQEAPIYLKWVKGNRLQVETIENWVDMLTFVFFDYQR